MRGLCVFARLAEASFEAAPRRLRTRSAKRRRRATRRVSSRRPRGICGRRSRGCGERGEGDVGHRAVADRVHKRAPLHFSSRRLTTYWLKLVPVGSNEEVQLPSAEIFNARAAFSGVRSGSARRPERHSA